MTKFYQIVLGGVFALLGFGLTFKLMIWIYTPAPQLHVERLVDSDLRCWRFSDDQGRGPGPWNCERTKDAR